jgi:CRISPR/Cas system endoribonuclease Cas6 (RAMP superfamily)
MKPVVIESWGIYRPFPEPTTVFRLLYERIQKIEGVQLPFAPETDQLEAFVFYLIGTADYHIQRVEVELERKVIGFSGWVVYKIFSKNKSLVSAARYWREQHGEVGLTTVVDDLMNNYDAYARLVNLLAAFAFYSGLGGYTAKGMGMVRKVERNGR